VRLLHETIAGLSYARNTALAAATGDIVLWTDDDVIVEPRWIELIVGGFREHQADFVFGPSRPEWEQGTTPDWFSPVHYGKLALIDYGPASFVVKDLSTPFFGLNFAVTRDLLNAMGRFREDLGVKQDVGGGEDIDLFRRAVASGHRIVYVPEAVVHHVIPPVRMTREFHRRKQKAGIPMYYQMLCDQYVAQPWLLGVPRFLYGKLFTDALGYVRSWAARDRPAAFHYELQLLKFGGVYREASSRRKSARGPAASVRRNQA
jgi:glycosyltransferase involved in cell wall biosynthesis